VKEAVDVVERKLGSAFLSFSLYSYNKHFLKISSRNCHFPMVETNPFDEIEELLGGDIDP
jgi:hypothetical protein